MKRMVGASIVCAIVTALLGPASAQQFLNEDYAKAAMRKASPPGTQCDVFAGEPTCKFAVGNSKMEIADYGQAMRAIARWALNADSATIDQMRGALQTLPLSYGFSSDEVTNCLASAKLVKYMIEALDGGYVIVLWDGATSIAHKDYILQCGVQQNQQFSAIGEVISINTQF